MGNSGLSSSKSSSAATQKPILNDYIPKKKVTDPRYGEATLFQHKLSKDLAILKELTTNDSKEFASTQLKWQNRVGMQHPNIVQVLAVDKREENQYCSSFYKTFLLMEFIKADLSEEIAAKIIENSRYQEEDIWFFLYCVISGLIYYRSLNVPHNALQPSAIFVAQNGFYKVVDHTMFNTMNSYQQILWNTNSNHNSLYLSPDLMKSLSKSLTQPVHNPYKSDIFTLGMIALHMASLENCDRCYDYSEFKIRNDEIRRRMEALKQKYNDKLLLFMKAMLIEDEKDRPEYEDLMHLFRGSYEIKADYRFKELINLPVKVPPSSLVDSKTYDLISSKKVAKDQDESSSLDYSKVVMPESGKKILGNLMQKAWNQMDSHSPSKPEAILPDPLQLPLVYDPSKDDILNRQVDPFDDEYLNLILQKEGEKTYATKSPMKNNSESSKAIVSPLKSPPASGKRMSASQKTQEKKAKAAPKLNSGLALRALKKESTLLELKIEKQQDGIDCYSNGAKYEGQKLGNKRHGKGIFYFSDGGRYEGEWKDDMMHGYGVLFYPGGAIAYKGYWALDKFHGYGNLNNKKPRKTGNPLDWRDFNKLAEYWVTYEGDFRSDNREGYGLLYLSNGEKYIGEFKEDMVWGEGNFYAKSGNVVNGKWEQNIYTE